MITCYMIKIKNLKLRELDEKVADFYKLSERYLLSLEFGQEFLKQ